MHCAHERYLAELEQRDDERGSWLDERAARELDRLERESEPAR